MPPTPALSSHRQTEIQEPSSVETASGSAATNICPGWRYAVGRPVAGVGALSPRPSRSSYESDRTPRTAARGRRSAPRDGSPVAPATAGAGAGWSARPARRWPAPPVSAAWRRRCAGRSWLVPQEGLDLGEQLRAVDRFGDVVVAPDLVARFDDFLFRTGR